MEGAGRIRWNAHIRVRRKVPHVTQRDQLTWEKLHASPADETVMENLPHIPTFDMMNNYDCRHTHPNR
jgi:hypothetical protein